MEFEKIRRSAAHAENDLRRLLRQLRQGYGDRQPFSQNDRIDIIEDTIHDLKNKFEEFRQDTYEFNKTIIRYLNPLSRRFLLSSFIIIVFAVVTYIISAPFSDWFSKFVGSEISGPSAQIDFKADKPPKDVDTEDSRVATPQKPVSPVPRKLPVFRRPVDLPQPPKSKTPTPRSN